MTDRHCGYVITLDRDIRADDAKHFVTALCRLRGVVKVEPLIADAMSHVARAQARHEMRNRVLKAIDAD
jgi:hypothetical protein